MKPPIVALYLLRIFIFSAGAVVTPESPRQGAALLKTDLMGIFAHPDDETGMAGTLAYYALAKGAVIANVYCTRGEGGGNMVGTQSGPALGILREAEVRDCLQMLGVRYCYFLDRLDWAYTESSTATLQKWGHEETLGNLVRMIRALRPEVILTMNPAPTPGQHGHHQAAGISIRSSGLIRQQAGHDGICATPGHWELSRLDEGTGNPTPWFTLQGGCSLGGWRSGGGEVGVS